MDGVASAAKRNRRNWTKLHKHAARGERINRALLIEFASLPPHCLGNATASSQGEEVAESTADSPRPLAERLIAHASHGRSPPTRSFFAAVRSKTTTTRKKKHRKRAYNKVDQVRRCFGLWNAGVMSVSRALLNDIPEREITQTFFLGGGRKLSFVLGTLQLMTKWLSFSR